MAPRPFYLVLLVVSLGMVPTTYGRKWVDKTGRFTIEAEYVAFKDGRVTLKRPDGKQVRIAIGKLSREDREFVYDIVRPDRKNKQQPKPDEDESDDDFERSRRDRPGRYEDDDDYDDDDDERDEDDDRDEAEDDKAGSASNSAAVASQSPLQEELTTTEEVDISGPVTATVSARWSETPITRDGQELTPLEVVIGLSGGAANSALAYGKLQLNEAEADGAPMVLFADPGMADPSKEFVRIEKEQASRGSEQAGYGGGVDAPPEFYQGSLGGGGGSATDIVLRYQVDPQASLVDVFAGALTLRAGGRRTKTIIPDLATIADGPVDLTGTNGIQLAVKHLADNRVRVDVTGSLDNLVSLSLVDGANLPIDPKSRASKLIDATSRQVEFQFQERIPGNARLMLETAAGLQEKVVDFEGLDIILPVRK